MDMKMGAHALKFQPKKMNALRLRGIWDANG
jgi:hypothetical protein